MYNAFFIIRNFLCSSFEITKNGFNSNIIYKSNIVGKIISSFVIIIAQAAIWRQIYNSDKYIEVVVYLVMQTIFVQFFCLDTGRLISMEYCSGEMVGKMVLPIDYRTYTSFFIFGQNVSNLFFYIVPMLIFCVIAYGFILPSSFVILFVSILSMMLGGIIYTLINIILSYISFGLRANWYVEFLQSALMVMFGGKNMPMWFFPVILLKISKLMPFYYSTYVPIACYLEKIPLKSMFGILFIQCFWIVILKIVENIIWSNSCKKIASWGG